MTTAKRLLTHMLTYVVKKGRKGAGLISAAYVVVRVWNAPHGSPQRRHPANSIPMFFAKKVRKIC